jgi:NAD(P)-dependent dehydrogenase (short-subunit alcohol dehydrogenase family)
MNNPSDRNAFVVTGPTSGMGRSMALTLATPDATVFLVARDRAKLDALVSSIEGARGRAIAIVADFTDLAAVVRAAHEITGRAKKDGLRLVGLLNNAGTQQRRTARTARGLELTYAVNHLASFALTDALLPARSPGATVVFVASGTEDPNLAGATAFGFRGARFLSVADSAHGICAPGGSTVPGLDAYATSKLCNILSARSLAHDIAPERVRLFAFDPGFVPGTGLAHGEVHGMERCRACALLGGPPRSPKPTYLSDMQSSRATVAHVVSSPLEPRSESQATSKPRPSGAVERWGFPRLPTFGLTKDAAAPNDPSGCTS